MIESIVRVLQILYKLRVFFFSLNFSGKGSRQNSSTKGSSNQKATHTNHPSLPSIHSNSAFPVVIGKAGTVGSANQAPGGNTVGSTRMGPTLGTINLATLPLSGKHGNSSSSSSSNNNTSNNSSSSSVVSSSQGSSDSSIVSLPLPSLNSSIPMKIMSATSSVSNKSQPAKSYLPTLDELKRPSEMQGSPSLPI